MVSNYVRKAIGKALEANERAVRRSNLVVGTDYVLLNEPCYLIYEVVEPAPDSKTKRRYRKIRVAREDRLAEYVEDMGLADSFKGPMLQIPCGGIENGRWWSEHTVEEAIDLADQSMHSKWDLEDLPRLRDLESGYHEVMDKRKRRNQKMFGGLK